MCFTQNTPLKLKLAVCLTGHRIHLWLKKRYKQVSKTKALIRLSLRRWMSWREMIHPRQHDSHARSPLYGDWCNLKLLWSRMSLYNTWQGHKPEQYSSAFPGVSAPQVLFPGSSIGLQHFLTSLSILGFSTFYHLIFLLTMWEFCVWI